MAIYYGKRGVLRVYDSTKGRDLSQSGPKEVSVVNDVGGVKTDITANMLNPTGGLNTILPISTDFLYIGNLFRFNKLDIVLNSIASADGGLLVVEYWNGTAWTPVQVLVDGTAVAGNTLRQNGKVSFKGPPTNWVKSDPVAGGVNLFFLRLHTTTSTATDASAQLIEPSSGQFMEVGFVQFDLNGPEGPPRPEEILVLNRAQLDAGAGYIEGPDDPVMQGLPLSFSCRIDDTLNFGALKQALTCGTPNLVNTWPKAGISTKTDSQRKSGLDGVLTNTPKFVDPVKKTVCTQGLWEQLARNISRTYHETYYDEGQITLAEAVDSVTLSVRGAVFGAIGSSIGEHFGYEL